MAPNFILTSEISISIVVDLVPEILKIICHDIDFVKIEYKIKLKKLKKKLFAKMFRDLRENFENQRSVSKTGRFVTMKPKTPTVAAKFHDSLNNLLEAMSKY